MSVFVWLPILGEKLKLKLFEKRLTSELFANLNFTNYNCNKAVET